jgi:hypothetical protein
LEKTRISEKKKVFISAYKIILKEFHVCDDLDFLYMCDVLSKDDKKSVRIYFENTKFKSVLTKNNTEKEINLNPADLEIHKINDNIKSLETNQILVEDLDSQFKSINSASIIINQVSDSEIENFI